jgi:hypothetical protein
MIIVYRQDIVKEALTDVSHPDVTSIPCELTDNYEGARPLPGNRPAASLLATRRWLPVRRRR